MINPIYQLIREDELELRLEKVTLETATNVTYDWGQLRDYFNNGRGFENHWYGEIHKDCRWVHIPDSVDQYFNYHKLVDIVLKGLEKDKKVFLGDISSELVYGLRFFNSKFKRLGFMWRPGAYFSKCNNRDVGKKKVSVAVLNYTKGAILRRVEARIELVSGVSISFDARDGEENRIANCKWAVDHKFVTLRDVFGSNDIHDSNRTSLQELILDRLKRDHNENMLEQTYQAIIDWWITNIEPTAVVYTQTVGRGKRQAIKK